MTQETDEADQYKCMAYTLKPGERMRYSATCKIARETMLDISSFDPTFVLTQEKGQVVMVSNDKVYYEYIYYINRISKEASDKLMALSEGPLLRDSFKNGVNT